MAELIQAPTQAITYCVYDLSDSKGLRFLFFIKADYASVQPVVDSDEVPVEFSLMAEDEGFLLTAEFAVEKANPPFSCTLRCDFPWQDPKAIEAFKVLLEQAIWPFFFISEDCEYVLSSRIYANPVTDENRELCREMITEQGL